jgi:hypothetical protein
VMKQMHGGFREEIRGGPLMRCNLCKGYNTSSGREMHEHEEGAAHREAYAQYKEVEEKREVDELRKQWLREEQEKRGSRQMAVDAALSKWPCVPVALPITTSHLQPLLSKTRGALRVGSGSLFPL